MELTLGRSRGGPIALIAIAVLVFVGAAYFAGLIQTLGYESRHVTYSSGFGTKSNSSFGLKRMLFFEGQTFFADYDADVRKGSLRIRIHDTFSPIGSGPHLVESITESGSGEVTFRIPETGIYSINFDGSVLGAGEGGGYDIAYSVRWGAR